jgi:hypothetical protein
MLIDFLISTYILHAMTTNVLLRKEVLHLRLMLRACKIRYILCG